jgi:hypothetical protein
MIASMIVFRRRYWFTHYIGAVVVIGGVVRPSSHFLKRLCVPEITHVRICELVLFLCAVACRFPPP